MNQVEKFLSNLLEHLQVEDSTVKANDKGMGVSFMSMKNSLLLSIIVDPESKQGMCWVDLTHTKTADYGKLEMYVAASLMHEFIKLHVEKTNKILTIKKKSKISVEETMNDIEAVMDKCRHPKLKTIARNIFLQSQLPVSINNHRSTRKI